MRQSEQFVDESSRDCRDKDCKTCVLCTFLQDVLINGSLENKVPISEKIVGAGNQTGEIGTPQYATGEREKNGK